MTRVTVEYYIDLDVSLKETHLCAVDASGAVVGRSCETTQPDPLTRAVVALYVHADHLAKPQKMTGEARPSPKAA